jgi:hypothetical protein
MAELRSEPEDSIAFQLSLLRLTQRMQALPAGRGASRRASALLEGLITKPPNGAQ